MDNGPRRFLRFLEYALMLVLVGLAVFGAVEYALGGMPFLVVNDNPSSMSPTINYGYLTVNYVAPFNTLKVGDIIVFHDPRGNPAIITHRIVGVTDCGAQECFLTKGDNNATNPSPDPWAVARSDYISEVILIIPYLGWLSPELWGFRGYQVLLPLAFFFLLVLLIGVLARTRTYHG